MKTARFILKNWENVNFNSIADAIRYHVWEHLTKRGIGKSLSQYTTDALNFFEENIQFGRGIELADKSVGIKITTKGGGPGGIFTRHGKIVSFWYK